MTDLSWMTPEAMHNPWWYALMDVVGGLGMTWLHFTSPTKCPVCGIRPVTRFFLGADRVTVLEGCPKGHRWLLGSNRKKKAKSSQERLP